MRRKAPRVGFDDMPPELHPPQEGREPSERLAARHVWLETNGLRLVDYLGWLRSRRLGAHRRPPSRRRWLSREQLAQLDAERERNGDPKW
jgi:hypothetical protein